MNRRELLCAAGLGVAAAATGFPAQAAPAPSPLLCRDSWGAAPPSGPGTPHTPARLTLHHTEVALGANSSAPARLRQHQRYHQQSQGWIDIAYHVSVDRNGNLYQLRDPRLVGDTATSYDPTGHFLVVLEGDFDQEQVTEAQLDGAARAFAWAADRFGIATDTITGHRDHAPETTCPGADLYAHVTNGDLQRRIDALLAAGPVGLVTVCGPQAKQIVADIEAGRR
ncbi:peptidoglycan recognition protein family protein [Mycolicibacterium phlei]